MILSFGPSLDWNVFGNCWNFLGKFRISPETSQILRTTPISYTLHNFFSDSKISRASLSGMLFPFFLFGFTCMLCYATSNTYFDEVTQAQDLQYGFS